MRIHSQSREEVEARHPEWDLSKDVFVRERPFLTGLAVGSGMNEQPKKQKLTVAKERRPVDERYLDMLDEPQSMGMRLAGVALFVWMVTKWSLIATLVGIVGVTGYQLLK